MHYVLVLCIIIIVGFLTVTVAEQHTTYCLKKNQNASRPSEHPPVRGGEMSKRLVGGVKGCKYKTSSCYLNGFPDGNNIGSTEYN